MLAKFNVQCASIVGARQQVQSGHSSSVFIAYYKIVINFSYPYKEFPSRQQISQHKLLNTTLSVSMRNFNNLTVSAAILIVGAATLCEGTILCPFTS